MAGLISMRRPLVMGILNASADSFANAGLAASVAQGRAMVEAGADLLDIGGESTRPGAEPVPPALEQARVLPLIEALAPLGVPISIDTRNAGTMAAALDAGAVMVNDVSGLAHDPEAAGLVARRGCQVVLMHMRGTPQTMAGLTQYGDVVADVAAELALRVAAAERAGIARAQMILDPGIGFAKDGQQNYALLRGLPQIVAMGLPVLVGASRKRFLGEADPALRLGGSLAVALFAAQAGAAYLRVHDVLETRQALDVWRELAGAD